jgi:ElaB/YqjD/DUF883 family membrane-anchored ribosome-binding protein
MAKATTPKAAAKPAAKKAAAPKAKPTTGKAIPLEAAPTETLRDQAGNMARDAASKAKDYANSGKDKTADMMDELSRMADDVAKTLDEKFGPAYGDFVRKAGSTVGSGAESLKGKTVDDLMEDARTFVREKPAVAIGAAAAIGFVLTRLFRAGPDEED